MAALRKLVASIRSHWRDLASSTGVEVATTGTGLLLALIMSRALGAVGYGEYAFSNGLVGMTAVLSFAGLINAVTVAEARGEYSFLREALIRRMKWAVPFGLFVFGLFFTPLTSKIHPSLESWVALTIAATISSPTVLAVSLLTARRSFGRMAMLQIYAAFITITAIFTVPGINGIWVAAIQIAGTAVVQAIELRRCWILVPRKPSALRHGALHRYSTEVSICGIIAALEARMDVLVVGGALGAETVGGYALAAKFAEMVKRGWGIANRVILPRWSTQPREVAREAAKRIAVICTFGCLGIIGVTVVLAEWIGTLFFGSPPPNFELVLVILVATSCASLPQTVFESFFTSRSESRPILVSRVGPATVYLAALGFVVNAGGVVAVALLRMVERLIATATIIWYFRREPAEPPAQVGSESSLTAS